MPRKAVIRMIGTQYHGPKYKKLDRYNVHRITKNSFGHTAGLPPATREGLPLMKNQENDYRHRI
jgi:hypothetical protein